jgi:dCMP deaminase
MGRTRRRLEENRSKPSLKWIDRFFDMAKSVASWSKDPSTKVGCVAVKNRRPVAMGYNGFPEGVRDIDSRMNDRDLKYKLTVHAEQNAVYNAAKEGVSLEGSTLFVYGLPCCHECAKAIIQSGVSRVYMKSGPMLDKWRESFEFTKLMFTEAGVEFHWIEERPGLPAGSHRGQGSPGPRDESVYESKAHQERNLC